jgi:hypothetical protein
MKKRGYRPQDKIRIGVSTLLVALFLVTIGTQMNRAYDRGAESFFGVPLNEGVCIAVLIVGSILMGMSIVFNVVGLRERRFRG